MIYDDRIASLRERAKEAGLSCIFIIPGANLYYMTGLMSGLSERSTVCVVPLEGPVRMVVAELEAGKVRKEAQVDEVISYKDEEGPLAALKKATAGIDLTTAGFEYRSMRVLELELLKAAAGDFRYKDAGLIFSSLRMKKDGVEIDNMYKAAAMVETGMEAALRAIEPGQTEKQVEVSIEQELRAAGVAGGIRMSIASGERSGIAHNGTGTREIVTGDLVWVDLMVSCDHYWADITRTFPVGPISPELQKIYQIVLSAQQATREKARPGMTGREIDAIARDIIESYGYGEFFTHRTGHGLGLEIHEEPYIVASADTPLEPGMTFTIEPGIYLPGKGGVRIEDDAILVPGGCRMLTSYRRNLLLSQKSKYVV